MSFPPSDPIYGNDCLLCYPPGLTPQTFAFSMGDVKKGDAWDPAHGQPQNGIHFITQFVPACYWESTLLPQNSHRYLLYHVAFTLFIYNAIPGIEMFRADRPPGCQKYFTNDYNTPVGNFFWGGTVFVMPAWEAQTYIELITPIVDPDPQLSFFSMPGNQMVVRYTDRWGDTNISMLVDI